MRNPNREFSVLGLIVLAGIMVLPGCASRKYVRQQVGTLQPAIQEAQNAIKENAERTDAVDRRAQQGITTAQAAAQVADQKATQAGQAAQTAQTAAQTADRKADTASQGVQQANNRINTVETRLNSLNDNYTASDTQAVMFKLNSATLSDEGKSTLDRIASDVSSQRTGYMIELQGFTDNTGPEGYNINLSQRRAENVLRYLVTKNVPLFRISIVGLGEANPVADNKTRTGRDQNRRVEVKVLKATSGRATNN
jgi:outer membrane protein OmpA-like peptidoglycan-associated protein